MDKRQTVWSYFGVNIYRKTEPGSALPYTARTADGQVAADTLAGIKKLIRESVKGGAA